MSTKWVPARVAVAAARQEAGGLGRFEGQIPAAVPWG